MYRTQFPIRLKGFPMLIGTLITLTLKDFAERRPKKRRKRIP